MNKIPALKFRQEFGALMESFRLGAEPLIIEKNSEPVAVVICYADFQKRFIDKQTEEIRENILKKFRNNKFSSEKNSLQTLRNIRYGSNT